MSTNINGIKGKTANLICNIEYIKTVKTARTNWALERPYTGRALTQSCCGSLCLPIEDRPIRPAANQRGGIGRDVIGGRGKWGSLS